MARLELDGEGWAELRHAYGSAADLPALLRQLPDAPPLRPENEDPWHCAWSMLCHQYSVSTASYASLPHLVEMAGEASGERRLDFLSLAGSIEAFRHVPGAPAVPAGLEQPYREALHTVRSLAIAALEEPWPEAELRELLGVIATTSGHPRLGAGILMGEAAMTCDACGNTQTLPGYAELEV